MAIRSGFFNSVNGDRKYDASKFAEYFASFIGNGVFPNPSTNLQVIANNDMTVTVKAGKCWINGYIMINDDDYILEIEPADGVLNRIDRVVARYDVVDREIRLEVKKGTFASNPVAPELQRDADAYELALADIYVAKGAVSITQANITDLRLNTELCGIVHGVVEQVDTTTLFNQYLDWYSTNTAQAEADIANIKQQFEDDINQFLQDWQNWYAQTTDQAETDINNIIQQFQDNLAQFNQDWNDWFSQQQTEGFVMAVEKGQPNGIATLDENGKVPDEQLPKIEVPVTSVNEKTGDVVLTAEDVGAASKEDLASHKAESVTHKVSNRRPIATDDETQNFKQGDIWIYENYINEEEYEFEVYQCIDNKSGKAKWEKYIEHVAVPVPQGIYGVEIDESNSNPETAVTYTDDSVGFTPARRNDGNFSWGSWENIIKEEFKIRPCVLKNLGGGNAEVNYYLDYNDFTKKADGTTANLTGADGDVMIEFGVPLWWKFTRINNKLKIQLSAKPFDGAVKHAFEIENGYNLVSFYPLTLTQIIYVLMFKNLDSQTALGVGRTNADSYTNTGTTNKKTFCYGSTDATDNIKFLGMEDYFGNRRWWIDGCFYDNNRNMLIGKGNFNNIGNDYTNYGLATPSDGGGYIDRVQGQNETGFIPASISGSATTYYCDFGSVYTGRVLNFGGGQSNGNNAGGFYMGSPTANTSSPDVGGRLFYSQNGKIYIGVYLGVERNGRLRSISGYESASSKTMGEFRNLARANNN